MSTSDNIAAISKAADAILEKVPQGYGMTRDEALIYAEAALSAYPALLAEARKAEAMKQALKMPFCVLFLDGRNEHGTHVLPSFPTSIDVVDDDLAEQAEAIMSAAEAEGFTEGDHVWAEFSNVPPQIGDEGRVELDGYWDFRGINKAMSTLLHGEKP